MLLHINGEDNMNEQLAKETHHNNSASIHPPTLRLKQAARYLGISLTTLWRLSEQDSLFPKVIRITTRCCVYRVTDLDAYLLAKQGEA